MAKESKGKSKLPKEIAGVKVPKELRQTAERALRLAEDHPIISEIVVAGLLAAAASLLDKEAIAAGAQAAGDEAEEGATKAKRAASRAKVAAKAAAGAMSAQVVKNVKAATVGKVPVIGGSITGGGDGIAAKPRRSRAPASD